MALQITPVLFYFAREYSIKRVHGAISARDRATRLAADPARNALITEGRRRLAASIEKRAPGTSSLSQLRLAAGLSQAELATRIGTKQPNIARMEKVPGDMQLSTLMQLSEVLGVSITEVIKAVQSGNDAQVNDE